MLSRIPGIAQLAPVLAATFSLHTNPTLRRYNDALAQAFYHHGRLCASNQATVMVLVIVFVGMISYPGIITSYNSSAYARQRLASESPASRNLSLSSWPRIDHNGTTAGRRHSHHHSHQEYEGNLDTFWTHRVIAPTWTQDPEVFSRNFPSPDPIHYIAPIIINATDLLTRSESHDTDSAAAKAPRSELASLSATELLVFAAQIQQRIETIVVEYNPEEIAQLDTIRVNGVRKEQSRLPRLVSLRDICVLEPSGSDEEQAKGIWGQNTDGQHTRRNCLVHSPMGGWGHTSADTNLQDSHGRQRNPDSPSFLFGDVSFHEQSFQEQSQASLVMAYFLRGDLGKSGRRVRQHDGASHDEAIAQDALDVRRVWRLIFSKLTSDLQAERWKEDFWKNHPGSQAALSVAAEGMVPTRADYLDPEDEPGSKDSRTEVSSDGPPTQGPLTPFMARVFPVTDTSQSVSRRLVSEESAQPRTNISAEYWLLGMAYFVMFLYISLSVGRVDLVKSKYGLGIAAVATVFVSLLMSIGLCSVFGVTLTLMPWEILPFMIIVVGVENINILVHAVVETSMDLPVRERVGRGLGTVGVSITMTLVAELCLLVIGAMTTIPAVQEFCTFAIAAVIMDYLLQMTFFITVISIDIRRLELSDLSTRPAVPYSRYPFGPRHSSMKGGGVGAGYSTTSVFSYEEERTRHQRKDSTTSHHSDGEAKSTGKPAKGNPKGRIFTSIIMVGVMAYLGYIYGRTNQAVAGDHEPVTVSYWRILSPEASLEFWSVVDPAKTGGYLEIEAPAVIALLKPSNATSMATCHGLPEASEIEECESEHDRDAGSFAGDNLGSSEMSEGQLDPRRPFKLLRDALVFICLFAIWLVRVFVIPSIILAAAILLLLSYLLSPQRKLLVDLQWRFPFIVLPGDYQSKRKLMMEELLAQEARELGQDPRPCVPLPGAVETLHLKGHKTDIDQMDISSGGGLILTSSMDGTILLWDGAAGAGHESPIARLEDRVQDGKAKNHRGKSRPLKFLKLDPTGDFAVAGYGEGGVHVWRLDPVLRQTEAHMWGDRVPAFGSGLELTRSPETATEASKLRVSSACFWEHLAPEGSAYMSSRTHFLLVGYRDGQIWQWDLLSGTGKCIAESKHRGGIAELAVVDLDHKTRQELGLRRKTYLVSAGKDGGIQCWSFGRVGLETQDSWKPLWGHSGLGTGVGISVLSLDREVPMVAAGYSSGAIKVWDLEQGNLVWTLSRGFLSSAGLTGPSLTKYMDRRFSQTVSNNHQPSHQGAITKLCFHALELEDGLTGEPAPRVWLVMSSSSDETVMVWMVEWEGLMCIPSPPNQLSAAELDPTTGPPSGSNIAGSSFSPYADRLGRLPHTRSFGPGEFLAEGVNGPGQADFLGTLTSSLPAPRLVGFMKQRGGKSMTVSNSCLYGVRRTESSAAVMSDPARRPSHASVLDAALGSGSNMMLRSRRKSESHTLGNLTNNGNSSGTAVQDQTVASSGPTKRGWELWEADLYQCIFKDPGVWGLDLTVRALNLQQHQLERGRGFAPLPTLQRPGLDMSGYAVESEAIMINSNGSAMAVPVPVSPVMLSNNQEHEMRPKLQRKPGSFSNQGGQRGYVYTASLANKHRVSSTEYSLPLFPTQSGRAEKNWNEGRLGGGVSSSTSISNRNGGGVDLDIEDAEPFLLPFVETRLVYALSRRTNSVSAYSNGAHEYDDHIKEMDMKDIVIGFGNFIKIVRLQDDEEEDEEEEERPVGEF